MEPTRQDAARDELRLALVLTGGVSLSVWIGGVATELDRLTRARGPDPDLATYRALLELTDTRARIDAIAGASAGGINGTLLALGQARGNPIGGLRDVWIDEGALETLLRSPLERDPPSLMRGDGHLLTRLEAALRQIDTGAPDPDAPLDEERALRSPLRLIVTTTVFEPIQRFFDDDYGSVVRDESHRGEFRFMRGVQLRGREVADDFARPDIVQALALAARSTASFPFAFEPSLVPIGAPRDPLHPNMRPYSNFDVTTATMDGGVLVNKPIGPLLRAVFGMPASEERVRRVLAYVVPDPGLPPKGPDDPDQPEIPTLIKVGMDVLSLPRVESVAEDLEALADHNLRVTAQRQLRLELLRQWLKDAPQALNAAIDLFPVYYDTSRDRWIQNVVPRLARPLPGEDPNAASRRRRRLRRDLSIAFEAAHPRSPRPDNILPFLSGWDADALERVASILLSAIQGRFKLPLSGSTSASLGDLRSQIHRALGAIRRSRFAASAAIEGLVSVDAPPPAASQVVAADSEARAPLSEAVQALTGVAQRWPAAMGAAEADTTADVAGGAELDPSALFGRTSTEGAPLLDSIAAQTEPSAPGAPPAAPEAPSIHGLLCAAMVELVLSLPFQSVDEPIELIQISGFTPNAFDERDTPEKKLAGVKLGHFGAFYKYSWRANDWMWGRLDAAYRLAQVLLHPGELRKSFLRRYDLTEAPNELFDRLRDLALAPGLGLEGADLGVYLGWDPDGVREDVEAVFDLTLPAPEVLDHALPAVVRRLQTEIAMAELYRVARSVERDRDARADVRSSMVFHDRVMDVRVGDSVPANVVPELVRACRIGEERFGDEVPSDQFTRISTKTAAVASAAFQGGKGGLGPIRPVLRSLKGFLILLWAFASAAVSPHRGMWALSMAALATGGALAAISLLTTTSGWVATIGITLIAIGLIVLALRVGVPKVIPITLGIAGVTLFIAFTPSLVVAAGASEGSWWATDARVVFVVAAIVVGSLLTGSIKDEMAATVLAVGSLAALVMTAVWASQRALWGKVALVAISVLAGVLLTLGAQWVLRRTKK